MICRIFFIRQGQASCSEICVKAAHIGCSIPDIQQKGVIFIREAWVYPGYTAAQNVVIKP